MTGVLKAKVDDEWVLASSAAGGGGGGSEEVHVGPNPPAGTQEIWYDTDAPGITPSDLRWFSAWGVIGVATVVAGTDGITATASPGTAITGASVPVTIVAGRKYRIRWTGHPWATNANVSAYTCILRDGGVIQSRVVALPIGGYNNGVVVDVMDNTATPGAHTYSVSMYRFGGTGNVNMAASTTQPCELTVEDMGPVAGASIPNPITALDRWNTAWGVVGFAQGTAETYVTVNNTEILRANFTAVEGRQYRAFFQGVGQYAATMSVVHNVLNLDNTTTLAGQRYTTGTVNEQLVHLVECPRFTTTAGAHYVQLRANFTGAGGVYYTLWEPQRLVVEDIGPSTPGQTITQPITPLDRWNTSWGILATGSHFAANPVTLAGSFSKITNPISITTLVGRRYRIVFQARAIITATAGVDASANFALYDGGASRIDLADWYAPTSGAGGTAYSGTEWGTIIEGDGAAHTYEIWGRAWGTNAIVHVSSNCRYYIEDVGPIGGAVAIADPAPAWIPVTGFLNGWVNYPGWPSAAYRRVGDEVQLRGLIRSGTVPSTAFNMPIGYRPTGGVGGAAMGHHFPVASNNAYGEVRVTADGDVRVGNGSSGWVDLAAVRYSTTP